MWSPTNCRVLETNLREKQHVSDTESRSSQDRFVALVPTEGDSLITLKYWNLHLTKKNLYLGTGIHLVLYWFVANGARRRWQLDDPRATSSQIHKNAHPWRKTIPFTKKTVWFPTFISWNSLILNRTQMMSIHHTRIAVGQHGRQVRTWQYFVG